MSAPQFLLIDYILIAQSSHYFLHISTLCFVSELQSSSGQEGGAGHNESCPGSQPSKGATEELAWKMNWLFMTSIFCNVKSSALPHVSESISPSSGGTAPSGFY